MSLGLTGLTGTGLTGLISIGLTISSGLSGSFGTNQMIEKGFIGTVTIKWLMSIVPCQNYHINFSSHINFGMGLMSAKISHNNNTNNLMNYIVFNNHNINNSNNNNNNNNKNNND
ncbi:hypothetical protein ACTFIW_001982 [Dictyostelium discoideum]